MLKISLLEKPVGIMYVLHFLRSSKGAALSQLCDIGLNRSTADSCLKKLDSLNLVKMKTSSEFPRFKKVYSLTKTGLYVSKFVKLVKNTCDKSISTSLSALSRWPRGCLQILVLLSRNEWQGISHLLKELRISPSQAYRCLRFMERNGLVRRDFVDKGGVPISSISLTETGKDFALCLDALDLAIQRFA